MPYNVTFDIADSKSNILGCNALLDEFTTAEFGTGTLTDVEVADAALTLEAVSYGADITADMTGDSAPAPNFVGCSTFFSSSYAGFMAFDKNAGTYWSTSAAGVAPCWIWYSFGVGNEKKIRLYSIKARSDAADGAPKTWTFDGFDGTDWAVLSSESNVTFTAGELKTFSVPPHEGCRSYRLSISANGGRSTTNIAEITLHEAGEYVLSGNRVSTATDLNSYGTSSPDLKIKWDATVPVNTTLTIETGVSDSNSTPPPNWYTQTNGSSITNLPADLTGKYLYYRANLATTDDSVTPKLEWVVIYDGDDTPTASVRVEFNSEIKSVPPTGSVTFIGVDAGTDLPYTVYTLVLDGTDNYEKIWPDGFADVVTVVGADVTETVSIIIPNAVVTQQYLEVAVQPSSPPNAVVTQQYIEVAYLDSTEPEPIEVLAADFLVLSDSSDSSLEDLSLDVLIGDSFSFSDEARGYLLVPLESIDQISFSDSNQSGFTIVAIAYDFILLADQAGSILKITLAAEDVLRFTEEIQSSRYNIAKGATRLKLVTSEGCYNITVSEGCYNITVSEPRFHIEVQ